MYGGIYMCFSEIKWLSTCKFSKDDANEGVEIFIFTQICSCRKLDSIDQS